ncbi:SRPBCC family protein [Oceanispirochaeta crateris]|uniref:SRPBCC family protein n=1 Tax=Oceanispirochaeta crateris TaxID=2518645 RepID=A0A5C1QFZ8_9SPIO|nr:SRPBCC family protein [Oceanispirochaeta crateris]QEN07093.1 SRPBCC family protein [Oceanispirochaeta crateris]
MKIQEKIIINGTKENVWNVISDIKNSSNFIRGIEKVEILDQTENSLKGLKWKETRILYGKSAVETMWITDVKEYESYSTRAESHGAIYISNFVLNEKDGMTELSMNFFSESITLGAKLLSIMFFLFAGATKKAFKEDLTDIKAAVEKQSSSL